MMPRLHACPKKLRRIVHCLRARIAEGIVLALTAVFSGGPSFGTEVLADGGADFAFEQRPGAALPADAELTEAGGTRVRLGDLLAGKPAILALGYFHCPSLCSVVRDDLLDALSRTRLRSDADYALLVLSIDPEETAADAAAAKTDDVARYPDPGAGTGWHFLTGSTAAVETIESAVGFKSRYDVHLKQFLHPAGIVMLTPEARVSGYVLGVGYRAGDIGTALALASSGGIAKAAAPLLLLCFHFDATTGRYTLAVEKVLRLGALLTVVMIGALLGLLFLCGRTTRGVHRS